MLLGNYFTNINNKYKNNFFSGISFNTKNLKKDHIFFAIKGTSINANKFIPIAIKKGSRIIVTEQKIIKFKDRILYIHTKNIRKLLAEISFKIYKKKPKNLIAVTGTNGKSSVADFYYQILRLNNINVASIGTLGVKSKNVNLNLSLFGMFAFFWLIYLAAVISASKDYKFLTIPHPRVGFIVLRNLKTLLRKEDLASSRT